MSSLKTENKCSHLFNQTVEMPNVEAVKVMFDMQKSLQDNLAARGRGLNYDKATFIEKVNQISMEWKNMNLEMAELIERLPHKSWKGYSDEQKVGFLNEEDKLEAFYEVIDVMHFFINVVLLMGITSDDFVRLYMTKNKENFDRQKRGY